MAADPHATAREPGARTACSSRSAAAGLAASVLVLAAGVRAVHVQPAAAHRTDVAGLALHLPGGQRGRRRPDGPRAARRRRPARHDLRARVPPGPRAPAAACARCPVTGALPGHPSVLVDRRRRADGVLRRLAAPAGLRLDRGRSTGSRTRRAARPCSPTSSTTARCATRCASRSAACSARRCSSCRSCARCTTATRDVAEITADAAALAAVGRRDRPAGLGDARARRRRRPAASSGSRPSASTSLLGHAPPSWRLPRLLLVAALATIAARRRARLARERDRPVQATLNLPIASSQPCVLVLALVPVLVCLAAVVVRRPALAPGRGTPAA